MGKALTDKNRLSLCFSEIAKQWHPTKNGDLTPADVSYGSEKKIWWICAEKGHEWESCVYNRTNSKNPNGCPGCSGKKAYPDNCLATLRPDIAKLWHPTKNGNLTPFDVTVYHSKKVWWLCGKGHETHIPVFHKTKGNGCKFCSNKEVCEDNCLKTTHPEIAKQWHPTLNGKLTASDVTHGSEMKVWWICGKMHSWLSTVYNRTNGNGCEKCSQSSISGVSQEWLDSLGIPEENREHPFPELKMRVDAFVPEINTVYEFLGDYWHGNPKKFNQKKMHPVLNKTFGELYEETKSRILRLKEAGYKVIFIWELDYIKVV